MTSDYGCEENPLQNMMQSVAITPTSFFRKSFLTFLMSQFQMLLPTCHSPLNKESSFLIMWEGIEPTNRYLNMST